MSAYTDKLKDPRWQRMRLVVFARDGWACQRCGDTETTLDCHHLYYTNGAEPWEYEPDALLTLCHPCHDMETFDRQRVEMLLLQSLKRQAFLADDLLRLATPGSNYKLGRSAFLKYLEIAWVEPSMHAELMHKIHEHIDTNYPDLTNKLAFPPCPICVQKEQK